MNEMDKPSEKIGQEQIAYYRARANEYDDWFLRDGRYDHGPEWNQRWQNEIAQVAEALTKFHPTGNVLEFAAGTGLWTERLALSADRLTALDAAPETLALNKMRLGDRDVRYVQADIFTWQPDQKYDMVFFSFWLSHVPPEQFDAFWSLVRSCLAPGGRVFFLDSLYHETSIARGHRLEGETATTVLRRLNDGREFRIVKVFYRPNELETRLAKLGWKVTVSSTQHYFLFGFGGLADD